ncbi:uncharacterized protein LOC117315333 [Pecten maximus]|uniref:uncharacterized protein LOC117315333 n=1 Tax=Pecten maximus TaxID=6579 RepID=UPI001458D3A1|nr:uncharacterized protein LOC117315333 [Pecten maximus]
MACGGTFHDTSSGNGGSKSNKWIYNLPEELGEDFPKFALEIGFKDTQIPHHEDADHNRQQYNILMGKWLNTIGRHTLNHQYVVFTALKKVERQDLMDRHFENEDPEKYSDDIWEDFLEELQDLDLINENLQYEDKTETKAAKKKKRSTKGKEDHDTIEQNIYIQGGNVIIGDNATMSIQAEQSSSADDENIRQKLHDIMKEHGAVGGHATRNTMNLQTLESCFHKRYRKSFKSEYGIQMLGFFEKATDYFVVTTIGNQRFVNMRTPQITSQTQETKESSKSTVHSKSVTSKVKSVQPETKSCTTDTSPLARPVYDHKRDKGYIPNKCSQFEDFLKYVDYFRGGSNLLLISKTDLNKHVDALANIQWLYVFDFDINSREDGLFLRLEDVLVKNTGLPVYSCTWSDPPNKEMSCTQWCFISGLKNQPESNTPDKFKTWYPHIKSKFEEHVKHINYMLDTLNILTVVAFWPEDNATGMKFQKIISVLNESISPAPQVVLVGNPTAEQTTLIDMISPDYSLEEKLEHVLHDLSTNLAIQPQPKEFKYKLPTDDGSNNTQINDTLAASLRECMDVLYLDNPYPNSGSDLSASEEEERLFFKGGTLSWQSYYMNTPKHFYVSRHLLSAILKDIRGNFVDELKSGVVKVFHAPGAGGTTLGQGILWELHTITPCVQIRPDSVAKPHEIAENITALYKKTHSPIVVLFDEGDEDNFDQIQQQLNDVPVILINLKRTSDIKQDLKENEYFLKGHLSSDEAWRMGPTFIRCCHDDVRKKDQIQKLVDEVIKGVNHHLIEFGLVIHLQEFKGLPTYVAEYLKIDKRNRKISQSQKVLGYLSLVQFFGQGIMPCQMFETMLEKSKDFKFTYDKFPTSISEFTVPVGPEYHQHSIRICHFLIAKEILNQLLSRSPSSGTGIDLSKPAKDRLQPFVLDFIKDLKTRQDEVGCMSKRVLDIIIQTFIYREGGSNDNQQRKRRFSRLIESIPCEQPFTERLEVLQKLAESFPGVPSLWAHLGRAYSLLRPTQHEKTEYFFQKAINGCEEGESRTDSDNDDPDVVLSYVLHMYGMFYMQRVQTEISKCRLRKLAEMEFQEEAKNILKLANSACESFSNCRRFGVAGSRESYGCSGEINVRLCVCEFLKKHYQFCTIDDLREKSRNSSLFSFVQESVSNIQHLFIKCFNVVDQANIDDEFYRRLTWYQTLFKGMVPPTYIDTVNIPDSFESRCAKIAGIKLKYGAKDHIGTVNDIKDERDIKLIVSLIEQNIEDVKRDRKTYSNMDVDFIFIDWIYAIRHPQQKKYYPLEDVLITIRLWNKCVNSPYSKFYLFVVLFTLAISLGYSCEERILKEAMEFKHDHIDRKQIGKVVSDPSKPREWLGKEKGVRCLQRGDTFKSKRSGKVISDEAASFTLTIFKGTIKPENKYREKGYINMTIQGNLHVPVKVTYCPFKTAEKLVGMKYAGSSVEFILAFTARTGLEAYNVKLVKKSTCPNCGEKVEMLSVESHRMCKCKAKIENQYSIKKAENGEGNSYDE